MSPLVFIPIKASQLKYTVVLSLATKCAHSNEQIRMKSLFQLMAAFQIKYRPIAYRQNELGNRIQIKCIYKHLVYNANIKKRPLCWSKPFFDQPQRLQTVRGCSMGTPACEKRRVACATRPRTPHNHEMFNRSPRWLVYITCVKLHF